MHPIFFAHGFLAYTKMLFWEQFPGVEDALRERGIEARRTLVHPTLAIETRARQLLDQINEAIGEDRPFHIVGHSMGGLDSRYLASPGGLNQGHRIRSVTTVSTPHRGAVMTEKIPGFVWPMLSAGSSILKHIVVREHDRTFFSWLSENRWEAVGQLHREYMAKTFNPTIVDHPTTRYFSYAARVNQANKTLIGRMRRINYKRLLPIEGENDGLVGVASAKWGEFQGVLSADHGELVGLEIFFLTKNWFQHIPFYVNHALELKKMDEEELV